MSAGGPLRQPIPVARSILWAPASGGARRPTNISSPVFLAQSALSAIHQHLAAPPRPGQGILGFLLGDLCECSETSVSYLVIDAALRLNQVIYGDRTRDVVTRLWDGIQGQLEEQKAHLIGWYHTHAPLPLELSAHDVETHEHYFDEPWQVTLLLGTDPSEPAGAFFRARADDEAWTGTPLPFYELLNEGAIRPDGKRRSFVTWKNYRPFNAVTPQPAAAPRAPAATPPAGLGFTPRAAKQGSPPPAAPRPAPAPPRPGKAPRSEDPGELKILTAAQDMPPAPAPRPASPPLPPDPAPSRPAPVVGSEERTELEPLAPLELTSAVAEPPEAREEGPRAVRVPRGPRRPRRHRRRRWLALVGCVVVAAGGAYWTLRPGLPALPPLPWSNPRASAQRAAVPPAPRQPRTAPASVPPQPQSPPPSAAPAPPLAPAPFGKLDQIADSLVETVRSFGNQAALFDRAQLPCAGLARSLVAVEGRWIAYNAGRRAAGVLDPPHAARDQRLYAGVDSVERRFEQSGCVRP